MLQPSQTTQLTEVPWITVSGGQGSVGPGTSTITLTIPAGYAGGVAGVDGNYSRSAMIKNI